MIEYLSKTTQVHKTLYSSDQQLPTWRLHHSLQVLLLKLLDALRFGFAVLLQAAKFVHILII